MTWPVRHVRILLVWAACSTLAGLIPVNVFADGLKLTAVFGIAGRYRPGGWCPVTVTVHNPTETFSGQAQVLATNDPNHPNYGPGGNLALTTALFARPVSLSGSGPQSFIVYARGIDPGRDTVTVQLTEGRERGDGRMRAQATSQVSNAPPAITGNPVADTDLFLVGFGGDPGAFIYLSGQKLGLSHQPGGGIARIPNLPSSAAVQQGLATATTQVAEAVAADLPDKAAGYSGVDAFLLRSDAPLDTLTEAQADALKGWVAGGGHLIVCGGADPSRFASSFYTGLLPAAVGIARPTATLEGSPASWLTLTPKPLAGIRVLSSYGGFPLIVTGPYGAGCVTMTAYDPTAKTARVPNPLDQADWQTLLTNSQSLPSSLLSPVASREENYSSQYGYYGYGQQLLSEAVMRAPALDAPGTEVIGLFLLVYLIALVPANYLILKRLDRKELAWVTIPALVLIFALGTFGVGYAAKGGAVFINRAAIVETTAGQRSAGVYAELGLFSPHRTTYDIAIPGANALAAVPNPGYNYGYRGNNESALASGQTRFVETTENTALQDTAVNMWAMRAFDTQNTTDLEGTVDASLTPRPGPPSLHRLSWGIQGTITNRTPFDLSECMVLYNGQWQDLGDMPRGASTPVSLSTLTVNSQAGSLDIPALRGQADKDDAARDISQRMRAALADYARSLGQQDNNYGNQGLPAAYAPASGEALLFCWSDDPAVAGPSPRVDGHTVKENDVSLLVVHLPVAGK